MLIGTINKTLLVILLLTLLAACSNNDDDMPISVTPTNSAPQANDAKITDLNGGVIVKGDLLRGSYIYIDSDEDKEGDSIYQWLRDGVVILNEKTDEYELVSVDLGSGITFMVTPVAQTGISPGITLTSAVLNIPANANNPPRASKVFITDNNSGVLSEGDTLTGNYTYNDVENDPQGKSTFRWLRNGIAISGSILKDHNLVTADRGLPITFEVTPIATLGALTGDIVTSSAIIFGENSDSWAKISTSSQHTLALKKDGTLWAWGANSFAQLGDNTELFKSSPIQIGTDEDWGEIGAGDKHSLAIKSDGSLWAWGSNLFSALGDASILKKLIPFQIGGDLDWSRVFAGYDYSMAIKKDATLWAWGYNGSGQLGINDIITQKIPIQVGTETWQQASAGISHSLAIQSDGSLWAWGENNRGQLGNGESTGNEQLAPIQVGTAVNWIQVSSGYTHGFGHSLALKNDQTLWAWGAGGFYQLGTGDRDNRPTPVQVGTQNDWKSIAAGQYVSLAIKNDDSLWAWGWSLNDTTGIADIPFLRSQKVPGRVGNATNWMAVSTAGSHTIALKTNGALLTWGKNYSGELGIGTTSREQNRSSPTLITTLNNVAQLASGLSHSAIIKTDGTLWTWGQGRFNQLGNNSIAEQTIPKQVDLATDWAQVAVGTSHNLAIKTDGTLWAWGLDGSGQLGLGNNLSSPIPTQIGSDKQWKLIAVGSDFSLAIKNDSTLWVWGSNSFGRLGTGDTTNVLSPAQIGSETNWEKITAGDAHSLALKIDGTLWAWGLNSSGQLGNSTTVKSSSPIQIGVETSWTNIAAGGAHSLAIKTVGSNNTMWAWGYNNSGQLGDSSTLDSLTPIRVGVDTDWIQISAGYRNSSARKTTGTLWAWGRNEYGQIGDGSNIRSTTPVQIGGASDWLQVITGFNSFHSLGLKNDNTIYSWGYNRNGQLGIGVSGNEQNRKTPTVVPAGP